MVLLRVVSPNYPNPCRFRSTRAPPPQRRGRKRRLLRLIGNGRFRLLAFSFVTIGLLR